MPQLPQSAPSRRSMWKPVVGMLIRVTVSVTVLFAVYYLVPTKGSGEDSDLPWLILELVIFGVVVAIQVPIIVKAKYPKLRAIEALAVTVPLFLLIFSRIYLSNSLTDPAAFTSPLDNTTALYFTVTVFATVGFGDIVAQTNGMRLLVTLQMLLDLAVLGLVIKLLTSAAQRGVQRRNELRGDTDGTDHPATRFSHPNHPVVVHRPSRLLRHLNTRQRHSRSNSLICIWWDVLFVTERVADHRRNSSPSSTGPPTQPTACRRQAHQLRVLLSCSCFCSITVALRISAGSASKVAAASE